tara:strand:+ start:343 stop:705 length:363 start_codon:yes stop_codon:yes gene_type:complete
MAKPKDVGKQKENEKKLKIKNFSDLLDSIGSVEAKKKLLWKEAYENALNDRSTAGALLTHLMQASLISKTDHVLNGPLMAKYLERMSKSNDQILRLAELISKENENEEISMDDIFSKIES